MSNCQVEEDVGRQENTIQTVSLDEAISFVKQNPLKSSSKTGKKKTFTPDFDAITQEKITNSDRLITVIPLYSNTKQEYSRILLLKIKGTIKSVVFSMYPDKDTLSKDFSGKIMITTIDGEFVNGFRVKNGYIVSQFVKKKTSISNSRMQSKTIIIDGVEFEELNEVIVMNNYHSEPSTISYMTLFNDWSGSSGSEINYGTSWEYSSDGGGGGGDGAEPVVEDPCDQLKIQNSNTDYLGKIQSLEKNTGLKNETGFIENKDGTFKDLINTTNDGLDVPQDVNTIGFNHTHIDDYKSGYYDEDGNPIINQPIKIFSPKDVMTFIILLNNANRQNISLDSIYGKVISSSNTYTLKFEGVISDINQSISFNQALDRKYKKAIKKNGLESGFLKFLKENGIKGVSLYKINTDGTAEKKSLDTNSTLTSTPCS